MPTRQLLTYGFFFFSAILCLSSNKARADEKRGAISECGRYIISGVVRKNPSKGLILIVNEKSKSEFQFTFKAGELSKVALYIDKSVSMDASILKIDGTRGEISSIDSVKFRIPDPLHPNQDSGFVSSKHMECDHE